MENLLSLNIQLMSRISATDGHCFLILKTSALWFVSTRVNAGLFFIEINTHLGPWFQIIVTAVGNGNLRVMVIT